MFGGITSVVPFPGEFKAQISLDLLPPTLREAVLLASSLGIPYIWIDQLCVDRGSAQKLHETLVNMGTIYECAELVIVAASGASAESGLPGSPFSPRKEETIVAKGTNEFHEDMRLVISRVYGIQTLKLEEQPWSRRGWTFQEYALATRSLVVFPDEMIFICDTSMRRESYSTMVRKSWV